MKIFTKFIFQFNRFMNSNSKRTDDYHIDWKLGTMTARMSSREKQIKTDFLNLQEHRDSTCGDPKKRKEVIANFAQSSFHGAGYVFSTGKSKCIRIFYGILLSLCLLLVIAALSSLLHDMLSKESIIINTINKDFDSGREEDPDYFPEYPQITICRKPSYLINKDKSFLSLYEYASLSLGYPFSNLSPQEAVMIVSLATRDLTGNLSSMPKLEAYENHLKGLENRYQEMKRSSEHFNLHSFILSNSISCEDFFSSCIGMVYRLECCEIFQPKLTALGLCYTMKRSTYIEKLIEKHKMGFTLVIDLVSPPHLGRTIEEGFHVFFSDPNSEFFVVEAFEGEKSLPGKVTVIAVHLEKWNRNALYTPWYGVNSYCPTFPFLNDTTHIVDPERFTMRQCSNYFLYSKYRKACNCESVLYTRNSTYKRCDPHDVYSCLIENVLRSNLSEMHELCHEPCITYKYKTEASYVGFGAENRSRIRIVYDSNNFIYHQYRTSTLSSFISQIGGSLGLYLGASIITVVEVIVFLLSWVWYKIFPIRPTRVLDVSSTSRSTASTIHGSVKIDMYS